MTTPENPAAPSARARKPRASRQNRPAQAAAPAQTTQNDEVVQVTGPAVEETVLVVPDGLVAEEEIKLEIEARGYEALYSGPDLDEVASPDPAHPYQPIVRTLLGPGFDAFLGESKEG